MRFLSRILHWALYKVEDRIKNCECSEDGLCNRCRKDIQILEESRQVMEQLDIKYERRTTCLN